jgi:hypothetical protein
VLSSTLNHVGGLVAVYAANAVDSAWAWLFVAFLASLTGTGWGSFIRTVQLLVPAVMGYYGSDTLFGTYGPAEDMHWLILGADVVVYLVLSLLVSGGLAFLNLATRSPGALGILASVVVPCWIAADALSLYARLAPAPWASPYLVRVTLAVGVTAAVGTVGLLLVRSRRWLSAEGLAVQLPASS